MGNTSSEQRVAGSSPAALKEAVRLFLEEADKMGALEQILEEAGDSKTRQKIASPKFFGVQRVTLPLPLTHVKP